jgi:hypothetical protein
VADNELLLVESGGRVLIDGITITQGSPQDLCFMLGRPYLVCLYLESEGKIANLAAHINGVFAVQKDNTFVPLSKHDDPLARDFQRRYRNDLTVMRKQVKQRSR